MPEYKYISRYYLMWALFFSLIVSICLIVSGAVPWQTIILEEALANTKLWQFNMGVFILLLCILGFFAMEAGSKGLSWLYVFCTIALALVACVHAIIDLDHRKDALKETQRLLIDYYNKYEDDPEPVDNFQMRMRCCGLQNSTEMIRGKLCFYVRSCCHWMVINCTKEYNYKEPCYKKANHVIHILKLCATLGFIAASVQIFVLTVLLYGGLKYVYQLIFPPGGPIVAV